MKKIKRYFSSWSRIIIAVIIIALIGLASYTLTGIIENANLAANNVSSAVFYPAYPSPNKHGKTAEEIKQIDLGEYLVKAGDCIACHTDTPEKGPSFAGGLPIQTAFGAIYSPNITPDKTTGIGNWTDEQFIKAMHDGISPTGEYYYPAFPYLYFNQITTEDLKAIKAYLDSVPAVKRENKKNQMVWPFNWRFVQLGWRLLFFNANDGPYKPDPKQTPAWNRGAYLVEGLGHCGMCHTPSYYVVSKELSLGAPIRKYNLTGAVVQGYLAPNITKTNLGAISDKNFIEIFREARLIGGGHIQGPMLEAVHDSLSYLTVPDILAMGAYLKTLQSEMPPEPELGTTASGSYIYYSYCSGCHSSGVGGAPKFGNRGNWDPLAKSGIEKLYAVAIMGGGNMPAKGTCIHCSNTDIKRAVDFMVMAAIKNENKITPLTPKIDGQKVYETNCSSCHSSGNKNIPQLGDAAAWQVYTTAGLIKTYQDLMYIHSKHPKHAGCERCQDDEILEAVKYMLEQAGAKESNT